MLALLVVYIHKFPVEDPNQINEFSPQCGGKSVRPNNDVTVFPHLEIRNPWEPKLR